MSRLPLLALLGLVTGCSGPAQAQRSGVAIPSSATVAEASWWGALPDDRRDDGRALQQAVVAAADAGIPLRLSPGVYHVDRAIRLPSRITLRGDGATIRRRGRRGREQPILYAPPGTRAAIVEGLTLVGTGSTDEARAEAALIKFEGCRRCVARDNRLSRSLIGVQLVGGSDNVVRGNAVRDIVGLPGQSSGYGVLANSDGSGHRITRNVFRDVARHAVYVSSGTSDTEVSHNDIARVHNVALAVYARGDGSQNPSRRVSIVGNRVRGVADRPGRPYQPDCIHLTQWVVDVRIEGNTCEDVGRHGIAIEGSAAFGDRMPTRTVVTGNVVRQTGGAGIWMTNALDTRIEGNEVTDAATTGIHASNSPSHYSRGTTIVRNRVRGSGRYGILVGGQGRHTGVTLEDGQAAGSGRADTHLESIRRESVRRLRPGTR